MDTPLNPQLSEYLDNGKKSIVRAIIEQRSSVVESGQKRRHIEVDLEGDLKLVEMSDYRQPVPTLADELRQLIRDIRSKLGIL
ncbi:MAG: hypothetical protein H6591_09700 [Flavobacteriales bacterium]|nr:hypothetical protein [Flavobacteriales bacterium]